MSCSLALLRSIKIDQKHDQNAITVNFFKETASAISKLNTNLVYGAGLEICFIDHLIDQITAPATEMLSALQTNGEKPCRTAQNGAGGALGPEPAPNTAMAPTTVLSSDI